jgi:uncharacterized ferredoxin-like protein
MIFESKSAETKAILETAHRMCAAARTAPKARGVDLIHTCVITGDDIIRIADEMDRLGKEHDVAIFFRDAKNVRVSEAIVSIGTLYGQRGMKFCQYCGFANCAETAKAGAICAYDTVDLGIAAGSAASVAADSRVDNRILYTAGKAILSLGIMDPDVKIAFGIPLSTIGKSPYFDRS